MRSSGLALGASLLAALAAAPAPTDKSHDRMRFTGGLALRDRKLQVIQVGLHLESPVHRAEPGTICASWEKRIAFDVSYDSWIGSILLNGKAHAAKSDPCLLAFRLREAFGQRANGRVHAAFSKLSRVVKPIDAYVKRFLHIECQRLTDGVTQVACFFAFERLLSSQRLMKKLHPTLAFLAFLPERERERSRGRRRTFSCSKPTQHVTVRLIGLAGHCTPIPTTSAVWSVPLGQVGASQASNYRHEARRTRLSSLGFFEESELSSSSSSSESSRTCFE